MWTDEALTINEDVAGFYGCSEDHMWYFMRYHGDDNLSLRGVRQDFFQLSGTDPDWIKRCHEQGLPRLNPSAKSFKTLSGGSLDSVLGQKGCIDTCEEVFSLKHMNPGVDPRTPHHMFQSPLNSPTSGFCVTHAFKNASQHLLSLTQLQHIPNLVTLDGFNKWLEKNKSIFPRCRLSKLICGDPHYYPPPGHHIVFHYDLIHHDSIHVHNDDTIQFYPSDSSVSLTPIGSDHPYVENFFSEKYYYRTVIQLSVSKKRKRCRRYKKKKKSK